MFKLTVLAAMLLGAVAAQAQVVGPIPSGASVTSLQYYFNSASSQWIASGVPCGNSSGNPCFDSVGDGTGPITASNPLPVSNSEAAPVSFSVTGTGVVFTAQNVLLQGYNIAVVQITSTGSGNTMVAQGSNDGTNYITYSGLIQNCRRNDGLSTNSLASGINTFYCPTSYQYFQLNVTTYGSGTITGTVAFRREPLFGMNGLASLSPLGTSGLTTYAVNSIASTNTVLISTGSHAVFGYQICNSGTVVGFFRFFDSSSIPVPGTTAPKIGAVAVFPSTCTSHSLTDYGLYVNNGLGFDATAAAAANDNTALTSNTTLTGYVIYQ